MGFRNPVTTVSGVDTGGPGVRVVVGNTPSGGAVDLLLPNGNSAGRLQSFAGIDGTGIPATSLAGPVATSGDVSALTMRGEETEGPGVVLASIGDVELKPAAAGGRTLLREPRELRDGGWKRSSTYRRTVTVVTDAAGLANIPHELPFTPSDAFFAPVFTTNTVSSLFVPTIGAITATVLQLVAFRMDNHTRLANTSVRVTWTAWE